MIYKSAIPVAVLALMLALAACKKETEVVALNYGYNYFPLQIGKYVTYNVQTTTYDIVAAGTPYDLKILTNAGIEYVDTVFTSFQMKEEIVDTIKDNNGRLGYKIHRYKRPDATQPWVIDRVWAAYRSATEAEKVEDDNLRFVRLIFPIDSASTWKATKYINEEETYTIASETLTPYKGWRSKYLDIDKPFTINGIAMDSTLHLTHVDDDGATERRYVEERYARNIGLIYRQMLILDTQCINCTGAMPWRVKAQKGLRTYMQMVEHGG